MMKRDELNVLAREYYSEMDISDTKKKKREDDAWDLFELFMLFFYYFIEANENEVEDYSFILPKFQNDIQEVYSNITEIDEYLVSYIPILALGVYNATLSHKDDKYFLSDERAANLALNESNTLNTYLEFKTAKENGYTKKRWNTELDKKVRPTHIALEGEIKNIDEPFSVGSSLMMFPKDQVTFGASLEEIVNCRCSCTYMK